MLDELKASIKDLNDSAFQELLAWVVGPERRAREARPEVQAAQAELIGSLVESGAIQGAESATEDEAKEKNTAPAWVSPGTSHSKMYLHGAVVSHKDKLWKSTHQGLNSWEPGTENGLTWEDITPLPVVEETGEPEIADFVQPTGAHDAYAKGALVRFNGEVYESLVDANAHSPSAHPAGWQML